MASAVIIRQLRSKLNLERDTRNLFPELLSNVQKHVPARAETHQAHAADSGGTKAYIDRSGTKNGKFHPNEPPFFWVTIICFFDCECGLLRSTPVEISTLES